MQVKTIYDIPLDRLIEMGIRGIITDLDNTLVGARVPAATPALIEWLAEVKRRGLKVVIVSNNAQGRVSAFAGPLSIPFIYRARKPGMRAFRKALEIMNLKPEDTVVIGDQMLTDVFGGRRMGLYTILVTPISPMDEGFFTRINRKLERIAVSKLNKQGKYDKGGAE
jgi:hypothetical protein